MNSELLEFSALDTHFAALMQRLAQQPSPGLELAAQLASRWRKSGHLCVTLTEVVSEPSLEAPPLADWLESLHASGVVGAPGEFKPLILDAQSRLYLYRYWNYEQQLAKAILTRRGLPAEFDAERLADGLDRLFPTSPGEKNWQRKAAELAVRQRLCVITGGPGTGKTRTVVGVLALLIEQGVQRIALAAPTGKAAARLKESLRAGKLALDCGEEVREAIPDDVTTLHRLLGARPGTTEMRHHAGHQLPVDAVVIDEASMVDVPLMARLTAALPAKARLILLGDRHQLASVEAGQALSDICGPGGDSTVELQRNYRFGNDSGIAQLSAAVNAGDADEAMRLLADNACPEVRWRPLPEPTRLAERLDETLLPIWSERFPEQDPTAALAQFARHQILCAVHAGTFGRSTLNETVERILAEHFFINPSERWYAGRPVMIQRNDPSLQLFNGDTGILLPDPAADGKLRAWFSADGELHRHLPSRLPPHETAYAMTVHKSQGSEFDEVLVVLPGRDVPVLTRELIYTATTRARRGVEIWADEAILRASIARQVERSSGLRDALSDK